MRLHSFHAICKNPGCTNNKHEIPNLAVVQRINSNSFVDVAKAVQISLSDRCTWRARNFGRKVANTTALIRSRVPVVPPPRAAATISAVPPTVRWMPARNEIRKNAPMVRKMRLCSLQPAKAITKMFHKSRDRCPGRRIPHELPVTELRQT